jgi:hypothetical protein
MATEGNIAITASIIARILFSPFFGRS